MTEYECIFYSFFKTRGSSVVHQICRSSIIFFTATSCLTSELTEMHKKITFKKEEEEDISIPILFTPNWRTGRDRLFY